MTDTTTCGPLYKAGLEDFTGMDPELIPVFVAGFVSGQAEKIYLGACQAAKFWPSNKWRDTVVEIVTKVADRYGLYRAFLHASRGDEVWLCLSPAVVESVESLGNVDENSSLWHERRGLLCGIPAYQIDFCFHERIGHNEPCDV